VHKLRGKSKSFIREECIYVLRSHTKKFASNE